MMLMTKFGKFKLRFVASINLAALLSVLNIASATSNYWMQFKEGQTVHYAGLWRSCPNNGECAWRNGIVDNTHSLWSTLVRFFITLGSVGNLFVIGIYVAAFIYKLNKRSKCAIRLMEWANTLIVLSFITIVIGFAVLITRNCNYSVWLHCVALICMIISSNMITRTFAMLYFKNTRAVQISKSCETALSTTKLGQNVGTVIVCTGGDADEKIALTAITQDVICGSEAITTTTTTTNDAHAVEMNKVSESNGSNEALIQNPTPAIAIMDVNTPTCTSETA